MLATSCNQFELLIARLHACLEYDSVQQSGTAIQPPGQIKFIAMICRYIRGTITVNRSLLDTGHLFFESWPAKQNQGNKSCSADKVSIYIKISILGKRLQTLTYL